MYVYLVDQEQSSEPFLSYQLCCMCGVYGELSHSWCVIVFILFMFL